MNDHAADQAVLVGGPSDGMELTVHEARPTLRILPESPVAASFREPGLGRARPEIYALEYDGAHPARDDAGRLRYVHQ